MTKNKVFFLVVNVILFWSVASHAKEVTENKTVTPTIVSEVEDIDAEESEANSENKVLKQELERTKSEIEKVKADNKLLQQSLQRIQSELKISSETKNIRALPSDNTEVQNIKYDNSALKTELEKTKAEMELLRKKVANADLQKSISSNMPLPQSLPKDKELERANSEIERLTSALNVIQSQIDSCAGVPRDPTKKYGSSASDNVYFINRR